MEKHFPAPDRNRISRLLGLDLPRKSALQRIMEEDSDADCSRRAANKRKATLEAIERGAAAAKKARNSSDSSKSDDDEKSTKSDSSEKESDDSDNSDDNSDNGFMNDSDASDDFNPFGGGSGSDSDADPWVSRQKKKAKQLKKKQKQKSPPKSKNITTTKSVPEKPPEKPQPVVPVKKPILLTSANVPLPAAFNNNGNNANRLMNAPASKDAIDLACKMKEELLVKIERLGDRLPPNTLDQLIDELGGPDNVAEMTGRKGRVVQSDNGSIQYESRSEQDVPLETLNLTEKKRFMDGEKDVAIISEAASSGISLQSDRRVRNQRRRVHITLELPWSADRAIQQFGRTHRSNQVNAPEYIFLISDLAGERRFASTVAKRLESLGALTHGDRRATETRDLSQFNIDNKYGRAALEAVMKTIMGYQTPLVPPPDDYKGEFFKDVAGKLEKVAVSLKKHCELNIIYFLSLLYF